MDFARIPRLSLDLLRGFRAAARHLSFTRAAQELCLTQPAVSREIRTLEEQIGTPLFRRSNRTLQLTQAGQELYRAVDEALALIDAAAQRVAGSGCALAVTTTVALASTWLVPRLPRFTQRHPGIDMRLVASNEWLDLGRERLDLALRYVPPGMPVPASGLLFAYQQFPVCSPALAADPRHPICSLADLDGQVLLDFETTLYGRPWYDWERWAHAKGLRGLKPAHSMRFSHYDQVIEAAAKGSGVAIGKRPHLIEHLRDGVLVAPLGAEGVVELGGFYLETSDTAQPEALAAFVGWLRDEIRRDAAPAPAARRPRASP